MHQGSLQGDGYVGLLNDFSELTAQVVSMLSKEEAARFFE